MATLITKNSSTASAVPAAGDLVKGELAVNVTDKKLYTKDSGGSVVKVVGGLGNQEANAVAITGGAINGTTIGATTASTGAFTTVSASSGFTGNLTGNVTGNVSGTAANVTGIVAIANGGTGLSALGTGVQSALGQNVTGSGSFVLSTSPSLTTPNLGTPSAAVLTNATGLPLTTGVTGTLGVANGGTGITAFGTGVATALGQNVTGSGGIVLATSPSLTTPNLGTPSAATLTNATGLPISTGVSGLGTGVATALAVNTGSAGAFVVNGGALGTPSSGTLTNATGLPLSTGVTGTLATTNGGTGLTSFTANGVVYASSSSALTTGSALSFDGTNFATTGSGTLKNLLLSGGTLPAAGNPSISLRSSDNVIYHQSGSANTIVMLDSSQNTMQSIGATAQIWNISNSEQMRLTSTGLGIGTSSPGAKLDVAGSAFIGNATTTGASRLTLDGLGTTGNVPSIRFRSAGVAKAYFGLSGSYLGDTSTDALIATDFAGGAIRFVTGDAGVIRATLDSSGNLGLGVTPSAWGTGYKSLDIGSVASFYSDSNVTANVSANQYIDAGGRKYKTTNFATLYQQYNGQHQWYTAPSGTAGNAISFTQAMTLDASGNLMVGTTSPTANLHISKNSSGAYVAATVENTNSGGYAALNFSIGSVGGSGTAGVNYAPGIFFAIGPTSNDTTTPIVFRNNNATERARITSGGYFKASNDGTYLSSGGPYHEFRSNLDNNNVLIVSSNAANGAQYGLQIKTANDQNDATRTFLDCYGDATLRAGFRSNGGLANYSGNDVNLSDRREKTNFAPAKSYLDTICAIPVQTFNYINQSEDDPGLTLGVVAQDVQTVAPELVMESNWGTEDDPKMRLSIYQTDLQYALMKCIQELKAQNDDLRARVAQLEAK